MMIDVFFQQKTQESRDQKDAHIAIRNARMLCTEMLREPIPRFAFSAALVVAVNGVSKPKKFRIRLNQNKNAKNSSTR